MFAHEARDPAPVPEGPPRHEPRVRLPLPFVPDDGARHIPALPARLRGSVTEIDILSVEPEAGVEPAELFEHRAAEEHEASEEPVRLHRLVRLVVEVVVVVLPLERRPETPQRRTAHERAADGREAAARRHELAVDADHAGTGD